MSGGAPDHGAARGRGRPLRRRPIFAVRAALALAASPPVATTDRASSGEGPDAVPVTMNDEAPYVGVNGFARLLDATKFWRADVRKLTLRAGRTNITFTVDDPFVVVNDSTRWLPAPVRSVRGELQ